MTANRTDATATVADTRPIWTLANNLQPQAPLNYDLHPAAELVVHGGIYHDATLATASWWDRYQLAPGTYPVRYTTIDGRECRENERPYYAVATVDAVLVESYRVNRLFAASSAFTERPNRPTTKTFRVYAYEVQREPVVVLEDDPTPEDRWQRRVVAQIRLLP